MKPKNRSIRLLGSILLVFSICFTSILCFTSNNTSDVVNATPVQVSCDDCGGTGKLTCEHCNGSGTISCYGCNASGKIICPMCNGSYKGYCDMCGGTGICLQCNGTKIEHWEHECWTCGGDGKDDEGQDCFDCNGTGTCSMDWECSLCGGSGKCTQCAENTSCAYCTEGYITCPTCSGTKIMTCITCSGTKTINCATCNGTGNVDGYSVLYDLNGAEGTSPIDATGYKVGNAVTLPAYDEYSKEGYKILGWSLKEDGGVDDVITSYTISSEDAGTDNTITIYLAFKKIDYTLTYDGSSASWNPSVPSVINKGELTKVIGNSNTTKLYVDNSLTLECNDGNDHYYTADNKYKVTTTTIDDGGNNVYRIDLKTAISVEYDANGGSGTISDSNVYAIGDTVTLDSGSSLSYEGYTFQGWSTSSTSAWYDCTTGTKTITSYDLTDNVLKLYAIWKNDRLMCCPTCNANLEITCPECNGDGDNECSTCHGEHIITCPTCNGVGDVLGYYVNLDVSDYTINETITTKTLVGPSCSYSNFPEITSNGYKFKGWNTDKNATVGLDISSGITVTSDITYYAIFEYLKYIEETVEITSTEYTYSTKFSDIEFSVSDTTLSIIDKEFYYYDSTLSKTVTATGFNKPGVYTFALVLESENDCYFTGSKMSNSGQSDATKKYSSFFTTVTLNETTVYGFGIAHYDLPTLVFYSDIDNVTNSNILTYNNKYLFVYYAFTVSGYSVTYDANTTDTVIDMPSDSTSYCEGQDVTISSTIPTREEYILSGWSKESNATTPDTFTDNKFTMGNSDVTLYAIWTKIIKTEPSKDNDYTVVVDESISDASYQWYKEATGMITLSDPDDFEVIDMMGAEYDSSTNTFNFPNYIRIQLKGDFATQETIKFKYDGEDDVSGQNDETGYSNSSLTKVDGYYTTNVYEDSEGKRYIGITITGYVCDYTIYDIGYEATVEKAIEGQTSSKLGSITLENTKYYCKVTVGSTTVTTSSFTPHKVSFDGNGGSGDAPSAIYQLEGREVSLPTTTLTKTNYNFIGWNSESTATTKLTEYKAKSTDTTLYAIWTAKKTVSIDTNAQTYTYDGNPITFKIDGEDKDLENFIIEYEVDDNWTSENQINSGSYQVKITRAEDSTYASFTTTINNGLVISKATPKIENFIMNDWTYGNSSSSPSATTDFGSIEYSYSGIESGEYSVTKPSDSGTYYVKASVSGDKNHNDTYLTKTFTIEKADNAISSFVMASWTYGGVASTPSCVAIYGTPVYSYSTSINGPFTTTVPSKAGTYYVNIKVEESTNYKEASITRSFVISKAINTITNLQVSNVECGSKINPTSSSLFGNVIYSYKLVDDTTWYVLMDNQYPTKVGTYNLKAQVLGNDDYYDATKETIFEVTAKQINNGDVSEENKVFDNSTALLTSGSLDININIVITKKDIKDNLKVIKENIKSVVSEKSELIAKFDIHLEDSNGTKIENIDGNTYKVTLTIPTKLQGRTGYEIVYIDDEGNVTKVDSVRNDENTITFETDHFSTWAIVADKDGLPVWSLILIILGSLLFIFIVLFIIWKIEYDRTDEDDYRKLEFLDSIYLPINNILFNKE